MPVPPVPFIRRPIRWFYLIADLALVLSLLGLVGIYILWSLAHQPGGFERHIGSEDSESRFMISSKDNRLIIGLYEPSRSNWAMIRRSSVNELLDDPDA